jgi:hypothetical protein
MDSSTASRLYSSDHLTCLRWFEDNAGKEVRFNELEADGIRLVTQFKGIFKPQWMPYAVSIRTTEQDRYSDGRIMRQADGSWSMSYAQEEDDRHDSRELYTNRGIEECINEGIPIGILRKEHKSDPYEVVGLGLPIQWQDGFFTFASYRLGSDADQPGSPAAEAEQIAWPDNEQLPATDYDERVRVLAEISRRQGQPAFRSRLLAAYGGRCVITGCDVPDAVEAAHITPYRGAASNSVNNGIILRADLHTLFDKQLIAINPDSRRVELSQHLAGAAYSSFDGKQIRDPEIPSAAPSGQLLRQAWAEYETAEQRRSGLMATS